jgi:uncharacterized protein (DUF1800 family)
MLSDEFYSERAERVIVKNPIDFCIATARQIGVGAVVSANLRERKGGGNDAIRVAIRPAYITAQAMKSMGMYIFYPPDVNGWGTQAQWISSGTMVERMKWAEKVFSGVGGRAIFGANPTPQDYIDKLISVFDANIPAAKRPALVAAATKISQDPANNKKPGEVASAITRLLFAMPEFQFA